LPSDRHCVLIDTDAGKSDLAKHAFDCGRDENTRLSEYANPLVRVREKKS